MTESKYTYGASEWVVNSNQNSNERQDRPKVDYMKLKPGSNELRIITKRHVFNYHKVVIEGDPGFGYKVFCTCNDDCPVCKMVPDNFGLRVQEGWYIGVIDRAEKRAKVLEIGKTVHDKITAYKDHPKYGDPQKYDIDIKKDKNPPTPAKTYDVMALPAEPLSKEDLAMKESFDLETLGRMCQPPTAEQVQKRLDKLLAGGKKIAPPPSKDKDGKRSSDEDDTPKFLEK